MIDKVQKIRDEVERLRNELIQEREKGFGSDVDDACILELQNVLTYIDSLQEESRFKVGQTIADPTDPTFTFHINKIEDGKYIERSDAWVLIKDADKEYELVEEPKKCMYSKDHYTDKNREVLCKDCEEECEYSKKEPVSEDLEYASEKYACRFSNSKYGHDKIKATFKAGAQWKEQQMIEKAFSGHVIEDIEEGEGDFLLSTEYLPKSMGLKTQQKVKVIVIKEE